MASRPARWISGAFYERIAGLRVDYGDAFRPVSKALQFGTDVVELSLDAARAPGEAWLVDPVALDGAFQGLLATRSLDFTRRGDSVLPWRFGRVRLLRPQGAHVAKARLQLTRLGPKAHCCDIAMLDGDGNVVLELLDCWFVRVRPGEAETGPAGFWTALVPTPRQLDLPAPEHLVATALEAVAATTPDGSELLARAYAAAAAWEAVSALTSDGLIDPDALVARGDVAGDAEPLLHLLLDWLEAEGLATADAATWRLAAESDLPAAADIWQSLLLDHPAAAAEASLAGASGAALPRALRDGLAALPEAPEHLVEQMFAGSPTANAGIEALVAAASAAAARWPEGRPLRIALVGDPQPRLVRRLTAALPGRPVLIIAAGRDDAAVARLEPAVSAIPGSTVVRWDPAEDPHGAALGSDGFDIVLGAFAFSRARIASGAAVGLLAPGGLLLALEPEPNRIWPLALGPSSSERIGAAPGWVERLALFGCPEADSAPVHGAAWSAAVIAAQRPGLERRLERDLGPDVGDSIVLVLADGPSPFAERLRGSLGEHRRATLMPASALEEVLSAVGPAGWREVVLAAPRQAGDSAALRALPELCGLLAGAATALPASERTRLWIVAEGDDTEPLVAGLAGLRRVMTNEGLDCRFVRAEAGLDPHLICDEILAPGPEREIALTHLGRFAPRLRHRLPPAAGAAGPRRLDIARPGLLGSLTWDAFEPPAPGPGEVAVEVRASGLNFRDVMWALGALPDEALMDGFSGPTLGLECAGMITAIGQGVEGLAIGDRVAAVAPAALATHVVTRAHAVMPLPAGIDFTAAATLPVAAMTAVYALGRLADVQPGERVLIHGGLGGVGLAAIQYARHRGAEVYATAGSRFRRSLLDLLGVDRVFDSRSAAFADDIRRATGGDGVDVVLNSLAGSLMQESLRLLKPFGRFLEIGKRDLFANTEIGVRPLRHNGAYFAIDADQLPQLRPSLAAGLLREIGALLADGVLRPLPFRRYGFDEAIEAFRLMQAAGHVGKIVLTPTPETAAAPAPAFDVRGDRTYVLSGGTAGFGLETARWLADHGARSLALLGRRGIKTPDLAPALQALQGQGVDARVFACDVADEAALDRVLAQVRTEMTPIGGVVHAAMVMDDGLLRDLDSDRFARSLEPKLAGASALDRLTREDPVELFLAYSSISAAIGNPGQANYVAANAAVEAVVARRRAEGLPGLAVQWGPIGDAGYLAREARVKEVLERVLASGELTARGALDALPRLAATGLATVGYASVDWGTLKRQFPAGGTPLFADLASGAGAAAGERSLRERIAELEPEEAQAMVAELLADEVAAILRMQRSKIDVDLPIADMGFDSLMALELRLAIESRLGQELPLLSVGGGVTLSAIAARVVRTARADAGDAAPSTTRSQAMRHAGEAERRVAAEIEA